MSDYRSAYEKYYKNINNFANGEKQGKRYFSLSGKNDSEINSRYRGGERLNNNGNYLVKRIVRELIGATLLLVIFFGMKTIPLKQVKGAYNLSKQTLSQTVDYAKYIETFGDLKIEDFKVGDIKSNNIKAKVGQFMNYLKNVSHTQLKTGF